MKITVSRSLLSDALRKVQGLAGGKGMPILSNVKIEVKGDKARFTTTDLDLSVVVEISCNGIEEGAITLPAKLLSEAIARAPEGDVSLEADTTTNKAVIHAGSSTFRMTGLPATDFPMLPETEEEKVEFSMPQDTLKTLFRRTAYAMSTDDTRRGLRGVHMKFADGFLTMAATDGRRLAVMEYHPEQAYGFDMAITLPEKAVAEIMKHLGTTGDVSFSQSKMQMKITLDSGIILFSKLIDDVYPDFRRVIPQNNEIEIDVDRIALMSAIERVGVFSEAYAMHFDIANAEIGLSCSTEAGNSQEGVPVKYDGEALHTMFNHEYILDALKPMDDDVVKFSFSAEGGPIVIKGSDTGLVVVMPLRM